MNVFVFDDDADLVSIVTDYLFREGYGVCCAYDLATAYRILAYNNINVVVSDFLNDGEPSEMSLRRCSGKYKPVILISGGYDESQYHLLEQGVVKEFLQKPFKLSQLEETIKKYTK